MNERARNVAVGVTVIVSLVLLCIMVVIFTVLPAVFQGGYEVPILSASTYDVEAGFPIYFSGLKVGHVSDVSFTDSNSPARGVTLVGRIDHKVRLPGDSQVYIFTKGFVGSPYVEVKPGGRARTDPATGKPLTYLPKDGSVPLQAIHMGTGMIPDELMDALNEMRQGFRELGVLARNLNSIFEPQPVAGAAAGTMPSTLAAGGPTTAPGGPDFRSMLAKLSATLDGMAAIVGDAENQANIKTSMANLAKASADMPAVMESLKGFVAEARGTLGKADATITKAGRNFDDLTRNLLTTADKVSDLLTNFNKIVAKVDAGEGTAGKLLGDPQLYNNLLEATVQLNTLMKDFRVLVEQWQKQGVGIKLR